MILDGFNAPPIEEGVGTSQASLFLDGNHTRVSLKFFFAFMCEIEMIDRNYLKDFFWGFLIRFCLLFNS